MSSNADQCYPGASLLFCRDQARLFHSKRLLPSSRMDCHRDSKPALTSQAFWAMHVEALNWSRMELRAYAAAMQLPPHSLRKWRDRMATREVTIDWRTHLPPSAR
ncbi:hypothetical protein ACVIJ6_007534 [Bradyrhizobium sp. USDA 4369]